jgi:ribosomal subunit interface protein
MLIDTRTIGFPLTDAILRHVEARFETALGPFAGSVLKASIRLEDINADHGGIDKRCSVVVSLRRRTMIIAEALDRDLYAAIDQAATRVRRSVRKAISQVHDRQRRSQPVAPGLQTAAR